MSRPATHTFPQSIAAITVLAGLLLSASGCESVNQGRHGMMKLGMSMSSDQGDHQAIADNIDQFNADTLATQETQKPVSDKQQELMALMAKAKVKGKKERLSKSQEHGPAPQAEQTIVLAGHEAQAESPQVSAPQPVPLAPPPEISTTSDADAQHRLGVMADLQGDFLAADQHYRAALAQQPENPNLLCDIGYSFFLRGDTSSAERYLQASLSIEPNHRQALYNLGLLYGQTGDYNRARAALSRVDTPAEVHRKITELQRQHGSYQTPQQPMQYAAHEAQPIQYAAPQQTNMPQGIEQVKAQMEQARIAAVQQRQMQQQQTEMPPRASVPMQAPSNPNPRVQSNPLQQMPLWPPSSSRPPMTAKPAVPTTPQSNIRNPMPQQQPRPQTAMIQPPTMTPAPASPALQGANGGFDYARHTAALIGMEAGPQMFPMLNGQPNPNVNFTPRQEPGTNSRLNGGYYQQPTSYAEAQNPHPNNITEPPQWPHNSPSLQLSQQYGSMTPQATIHDSQTAAHLQQERQYPTGNGAYSPQFGQYYMPPQQLEGPYRTAEQ
ncbi:tetratricopeptide repeat protein [Calycomorphotria hydatis]|uniref:Tetratricopeptide repeat protein n=1 Tax=Calycomorphotria hydatis TaxID=2528027 RepID=A0A517T5T1_9PLAN|nr:tetratricopeptide repeat protein [Calycomorphotria hydatis]QDT63724.1 Tetratricopeptide repeat protein [Calycomorphotria hydatis]